MAVNFKREVLSSRFLNPFEGYQETEGRCELRWDPLTGQSGRLAHFVGFKPPPAQFEEIIAQSSQSCPFCPEHLSTWTPRFPQDIIPEGRLVVGQACLFPNLLPYDEHSSLAVLGERHYLSLQEARPELLLDGFEVCLQYFKRIALDPAQAFALINWNYMPPAGSSQIHPHLQVYLTRTPGNALQRMISASSEYLSRTGRSFWQDFLDKELELGERIVYVGRNMVWLTAFISSSPLADIQAIFPGKSTLFDFDRDELEECVHILSQVLGWLGAQGVYSLNMAWFPGLQGQDGYTLQLKISPRLYLAPQVWCTDTPALTQLYQEPFMIWSPEDVAQKIRKDLEGRVQSGRGTGPGLSAG